MFALGDRNGGGDPSTFLVGAGALAGGGALLGSLVARLGGDGSGDADRIRPATLGLDYRVGTPASLDETNPHQARVSIAPNYFLSRSSRLRLFGHLGGDLWTRKIVDPRPQNQSPLPDQDSTAPVVGTERDVDASVGLDLAVGLPYPVRRPSKATFLGAAELRYRPAAFFSRERVDVGSDDERVIERTMLLPLTIGTRWHLSGRQRFTLYFGPRFDFVAFSEPGSRRLARGPARLGPLYGEAWYDLDVPHTLNAQRRGRSPRTRTNSQLSFGYIHSRFDGRGFNFGPVVGFLGPIHARWATRVRPQAWPVALQFSAALAVGNGVSGSVGAGGVLPDLGTKGQRQR